MEAGVRPIRALESTGAQSGERDAENPDDKYFECVRHVQWCDIRPVAGTAEATMEVTTWRRFRNTDDQTRVMMVGLAIDDFGLSSGRSRVESVAYRIGGSQWISVSTNLAVSSPGTLAIPSQSLAVPGQTIMDVETRYVEVRRSNDEHTIHYRVPTVDPLVIVRTIYQHSANFSHGIRNASASPAGA